MIRRVLVTLAAFGALAGALSSAAAGAAQRPASRAALKGFGCHSTLEPAARSVSVTSVMRPVPGTRSLAVRFSLLEHVPGTPGQQSVGPTGDLGRWLTPADVTLGRRTDDVWKLAKSVSNVAAPAGYRFVVDFRWRGPGGRILATDSRRTPTCHERELRPDVFVRRVIVRPSAGHAHRGGHDAYVAVIANRGASPSGPFSVSFTPGTGAGPKSRRLPSLASGAHVRVTFNGPVCRAASPPTVVADPAHRVDDYDRSNNTLTVACPR